VTGRPPSGERGFSSSLEWAMLMPVVLALVFIIIQVGLMAHGRTVAFNAAAAAAEEASVVRASPAAGTAVAQRLAAQGGLVDVQVSISGGTSAVTARVTGRVPSLIDHGHAQISEQVTRPRERLTRP